MDEKSVSKQLKRAERELASLLPFAWDRRVQKHPPGQKAIADFTDVLNLESFSGGRRARRQHTPEGGPISADRGGEARTAAKAAKRPSPTQGSGRRQGSKTPRVDVGPCSAGQQAMPASGEPAAAPTTTPAAPRPSELAAGSPAVPHSCSQDMQTPAVGLAGPLASPVTTAAPHSTVHDAAIMDAQFMPTPRTALPAPRPPSRLASSAPPASRAGSGSGQLLSAGGPPAAPGSADAAGAAGGGHRFRSPEPRTALAAKKCRVELSTSPPEPPAAAPPAAQARVAPAAPAASDGPAAQEAAGAASEPAGSQGTAGAASSTADAVVGDTPSGLSSASLEAARPASRPDAAAVGEAEGAQQQGEQGRLREPQQAASQQDSGGQSSQDKSTGPTTTSECAAMEAMALLGEQAVAAPSTAAAAAAAVLAAAPKAAAAARSPQAAVPAAPKAGAGGGGAAQARRRPVLPPLLLAALPGKPTAATRPGSGGAKAAGDGVSRPALVLEALSHLPPAAVPTPRADRRGAAPAPGVPLFQLGPVASAAAAGAATARPCPPLFKPCRPIVVPPVLPASRPKCKSPLGRQLRPPTAPKPPQQHGAAGRAGVASARKDSGSGSSPSPAAPPEKENLHLNRRGGGGGGGKVQAQAGSPPGAAVPTPPQVSAPARCELSAQKAQALLSLSASFHARERRLLQLLSAHNRLQQQGNGAGAAR